MARICPDLWSAEGTIFIALAHILSVFKIERKVVDEGQNGGGLEDVKWSGGMIR
jgi:hypothetical protein